MDINLLKNIDSWVYPSINLAQKHVEKRHFMTGLSYLTNRELCNLSSNQNSRNCTIQKLYCTRCTQNRMASEASDTSTLKTSTTPLVSSIAPLRTIWPISIAAAAIGSAAQAAFHDEIPTTDYILPASRDTFCKSCTNITRSNPTQKTSTLALNRLISKTLPSTLQEQPFDSTGFDKIFSSSWLSDTTIVFGTKCNRLVALNVETQQNVIVPLSSPSEPSTDQTIDSIDYGDLSGACSGIHAIALNPSRTLLAVGCGLKSENIQIFTVPSLQPLAKLVGHKDMVFSLQWLGNSTLVSGSRDRSVKLWDIPHIKSSINAETAPVVQCKFSRIEHKEKVRDLVSHKRDAKSIYTLSADGFVKIWDVQAALSGEVTSVPLIHKNELVCMALDSEHNILSVGSQSHISLIDPRVGRVVQVFDSADDGWGVRSMVMKDNMVTIGGGVGRISFFDLKNMKYIDWETNNKNPTASSIRTSPTKSSYHQASSGWLFRDSVYVNLFENACIKNAVYTIAYDFSGKRLFAAGGPLQLNLKGSYVSLWQ